MVVLGTVLVAALGLCALGIHAQQGGSGARSGYGTACNIEGLWAEVAFTLKVADAKLLEMRPAFQKAWGSRDEISAGVTSTEEIMPGVDKLEALGGELLDLVKKNVTEEQFTKLSPWVEEQKGRVEMVRQSARIAATVERLRREREKE
jgi:hypothetical protein